MKNLSPPVYTDEPCSVTVDGQTYTLAEFGEDSSQIVVCISTYANNSVKNTFQGTMKTNLLGFRRFRLLQISFINCCFIAVCTSRRQIIGAVIINEANQAFKRLLPADMCTARNNAASTGLLPGHSKTFPLIPITYFDWRRCH